MKQVDAALAPAQLLPPFCYIAAPRNEFAWSGTLFDGWLANRTDFFRLSKVQATTRVGEMLKLKVVIAAAIAAFFVAPVAAQSATPLDQFRDWAAFKADTNNGPVCYVLTQPQSMEPQGVRRGDVFLYVTSRPSDDVHNEVSVITGYPYREGSRATVEIGSESFSLVTRDDGAWIENVAEEERLIEAMRGGSTMTVRGTSQRGTDTTDRYSLLGVSAALERIAEECS